MTVPIRVLIVEDSEDDAQLVLRQLRTGGYDPHWERVDTREGMQRALDGQVWDVIICDYTLPRFDALAALKSVQESEKGIPFIIVSGKIGEDTAVAAMKAGAHDYVMKDKLNRLPAAVEREIRDASTRREHKLVKVELLASEALARGILEHVQDAYIRVDMGGRLVMVSPSAASLYGYGSSQEMLGLASLALYVNEEERNGVMEALTQHGSVCDRIGMGRKKDGTLFWVSLNARFFANEQGQVAGAECFVRDITERKRAERAMEQSEQKYRSLYQNAALGIFHSTLEGAFIDVNPALAKMLGYASPEEVVSTITNIAEQVYAEPLQRDAVVAETLQAGGLLSADVQYRRADGAHWDAMLHLRLVKDAADKPSHYEGFVEDITQRKQAEMQLSQLHHQLQLVLNSTSEGIVGLDLQGKHTFINRAAATMLGYEVEELLGRPSHSLWHHTKADGSVYPFEQCEILSVIRDGAVRRFPIDLLWRKDGTSFSAELASTPMIEDGVPVGVVVTFTDVTGRRQAEETLRASEAKFRMLFQSNQSIQGLSTSKDGCYIDVNDEFLRVTGFRREEVIGRTALELGIWETAERRAAVVDAVSKREAKHNVETRMRTKSGSIRTLLCSIEQLISEGESCLLVSAIDITERNRAEEALRDNELKYRTLFETADDAILLFTDDQWIDCNRAALKVFGCTREQIIGAHPKVFSPPTQPDGRDSTAEAIKRIQLAYMERPQSFEWTHCRMDGTPFPAEVSLSRLELGGKPHMQAIVRDVTERKRAGQELDAYRTHLEHLVEERTKEIELLSQLTFVSLESASVGAWWINFEEDDIYHALDTTAKMIGIPVSQLPNKAYRISEWVEVLREAQAKIPEHAKMVDRALEQFVGTISGKYEKYRVVYPIVKPDQAVTWIDARADVTARDKDGRALTMTGTLIDVTKLIEAEKEVTAHKTQLERLVTERTEELALRNRELQTASERLILATRAAKIGVWDWDVVKDELVWDDAMYGLYGIRRGEFSGAYAAWSETIHPDDKARAEEAIQQALRGEREYTPEFRVIWPDSSIHYIQAASRTFRTADGSPIRMVGINFDTTERKQSEQERETLEAQLRASQKMEAIGSLAGGVAHDFNNLISVILSYTSFAIDNAAGDDALRNDLLEVTKAGERAAALTRQLLAFSRKQVMQPLPLNLNQIAIGIETMLRRILGENIDFAMILAPDLGLTMADPGQIEQVLMNLVVNAHDAMPMGGKLTIETSNVEVDGESAEHHLTLQPGLFVRLTVTDTGCGMDEPTRVRIFEPFFTTKEVGKGTGLGLSTVYGIVKQSGGDIWLYSELGHGTTFKIYLPRELSVVKAMSARPQAELLHATGTETILVVEDEEALRNVAMRVLVAAGYHVLMAANGYDALLVFGQHEGDIPLLVTDVVMPRMSGRELADRLKSMKSELKVLYMSGYTDDAIDRHGVLEAGTHFLPKPFTGTELTRKVRQVLDSDVINVVYAQEPAFGTDSHAETRASSDGQSLDKEASRSLPQDVADELRTAIVSARYDELIGLIDSIQTATPAVAVSLRRMAEQFDYDGMQALLGLGDAARYDG